MLKKFKKVLALGLAGSMVLTGCATGEDTPKTEGEATTGKEDGKNPTAGEPTVIRIGSHAGNGMNPNYKDPITGEYAMNEIDRESRLQAMQKVKDELNVEIEWVQFPGETTEVLLQSVLAGDPVADIVNLYANSQGIILGQNILQPLDDHLDAFGVEPPASLYGKHYFLSVAGGKTHPLSPLYYNVDYIEQVDALKVDGKTVYPTDLYKEGKWTWSVFEDYLAKIDAHFANSQAPVRPEKRIDAYRTDYTETLIQAMHSAGGSIYGDNGLAIESKETKEAIAFVQNLVDKGLLVSELVEGTSKRPYNAQGGPFEMGESVFTNIEDWRGSAAAKAFAGRDQSLGFIPFPRPDHMAIDDPNYRQVRTGGETWAILRGIEDEKIPLAIKTFEMFESERSRVDKELNGIEDERPAIRIGIDLFHEEIGTDMEDIYYESIARTNVNEFSNMTGVYWTFMGIAGDAIYGIDGTPSYEVAIEARKSEINSKIADVETILNGAEARDNIKPAFKQVEEGKTYAFAKGTDLAAYNWNAEFTVEDNLDGVLDAATVKYDTSAVDVNTVGLYNKGVVGTISDASENEGKQEINVVIYDGANTTEPTLTMKAEYRTLKVDEDASKVNWAGDFVEVAQDKDGLDLKGKVAADLSEIDTTTAGKYNVAITVTDFAGNTATQTIEVEVVAE